MKRLDRVDTASTLVPAVGHESFLKERESRTPSGGSATAPATREEKIPGLAGAPRAASSGAKEAWPTIHVDDK